jgi:hypothetical protein
MFNLGILASSGGAAAATYDPTTDANLIGWFDMSDTGSITESAGLVSAQDDISTNGADYSLTQTVAANKPVTNSNTINSLNVINFPSADCLFLNTDLDFMNRTILMVIKSAATATQVLLGARLNINKTQVRLDGAARVPTIVYGSSPWGAPSISTLSVPSGAATVVGFIGGVKVGFSVNDTSELVGADRTNTNAVYVDLMGARNTTAAPFVGDIAEVLFIDEVLEGVDLLLRIEYLNNKWACY